MILYIVRHGIAQQRGGPGVSSDSERALSPKGKVRTLQVARGLERLGCRPGRICTSPLVRAEETARIMDEVLCPEAPLDVCDFLAPGATTTNVVKWLRSLEEDCAMTVGHMPDAAVIASGLLVQHADMALAFKKAAVCCISFDGVPGQGTGQLEWLLQPRQSRAIAGDLEE